MSPRESGVKLGFWFPESVRTARKKPVPRLLTTLCWRRTASPSRRRDAERRGLHFQAARRNEAVAPHRILRTACPEAAQPTESGPCSAKPRGLRSIRGWQGQERG